MYVHLIDGTYELFRHHFGAPSYQNEDGLEVGAVRGVVFSVLGMFRDGATHVAVATDQVIESFRNDMWPGYKTGEGIEPELRAQFPVLEEALAALGVTVWPMVEHEADDGLASGAAMAAADERVVEVRICTPDKDLAQCVDAGRGGKTVQVDRRRGLRWEADGIREKFGVEPESIPDYLALVGDSADGFPGLRGWGAKSTATVLAHYVHLEHIPDEPWNWAVKVRGRDRLAATLREERASAELFRELATLVRDAPVSGSVDELRWRGPRPELGAVAGRLAAPGLVQQAERVATDST
ncbi:MAG: flap endonuclease [Acidobacteria bacterium]|nr:flap endonuclease [Acidobacteriota bacterium]